MIFPKNVFSEFEEGIFPLLKIAPIYFYNGYKYNLNVFKSTIIYKQKFRQYCLIFLRKFVDNFFNRFQNKLYKEIGVYDFTKQEKLFSYYCRVLPQKIVQKFMYECKAGFKSNYQIIKIGIYGKQ